MIKTFYELNEYLSLLLQEGKPASVIRLDNTAGYVIDCLVKKEPISKQFFNAQTILEGGVYPNTEQYAIEVAYANTYDCMKRADCVGFVDISKVIRNTSPLLQYFSDKVMFFSDGYMIFDPGSILGYSKLYIEHLNHPESFIPWTKYLAGKKVLVISTHVESIKQQWSKREQVWGDRLKDIVPFELVDVIRAPYHPAIDSRQYINCLNWWDMVTHMKELIKNYEFDVLLSGASTSSPMFVDYAKHIGKIGIQTGGVLQLFFGVMGGRWSKVTGYADWHKMFNHHWIYPLKVDEPQNKLQDLESSFAYWG